MNLKQRNGLALITGASSGIGATYAGHLARLRPWAREPFWQKRRCGEAMRVAKHGN
jgi:hypothetical protein